MLTTVRTAAWSDVKSKARRLRREGQVFLTKLSRERVDAIVEGDHGTYSVTLLRENPDNMSVTSWICSCPWGQWAWDRVFYYGRFCSHAAATLYASQSEVMRGRQFEGSSKMRLKRETPKALPSLAGLQRVAGKTKHAHTQEVIHEPGVARNLSKLRLQGSIYEDLDLDADEMVGW